MSERGMDLLKQMAPALLVFLEVHARTHAPPTAHARIQTRAHTRFAAAVSDLRSTLRRSLLASEMRWRTPSSARLCCKRQLRSDSLSLPFCRQCHRCAAASSPQASMRRVWDPRPPRNQQRSAVVPRDPWPTRAFTRGWRLPAHGDQSFGARPRSTAVGRGARAHPLPRSAGPVPRWPQWRSAARVADSGTPHALLGPRGPLQPVGSRLGDGLAATGRIPLGRWPRCNR
jgi:hypothetical protein